MLGSVWVSMPEDWLNVTVPSMVVKGTQETIDAGLELSLILI